ncbi:MAG: class I SAM-dependent methyltransferase, partial [bacterium]
GSEITDPAQLLEMANAFRVSRIILTAHELGIFDQLKGQGNTSEKIAQILGTKPRATDRLLNALVSIGLLHKKSGIFQSTGFSEKFLVSDSPAFLSGLSLINHTWKTWSTLTEAVRAGTSVYFEDSINERPEEWQQAFIAAMHRRAGPQAVEVADVLDLSHTTRVLDVGGGSGAFTFEFLKRNPGMMGVVFDLPNIVPLTERFINPSPGSSPGREEKYLAPGPSPQGEGNIAPPLTPPQKGRGVSSFSDRVLIKAGDYLKDDFGSGFDLVFMSAIIHINSPEENRLLIRKGAEALNPGGRLVILDHIMTEDRTEPLVGALFAINMLVGTLHGDTYTKEEIRSWMLDAGLLDVSMITTPGGLQLMTGNKVQGSRC